MHLKTAGTTWLEELIGLAEHGGEGLMLAQEIYAEALAHIVRALRHNQADPLFNSNLRQLLHVGFKVAAKLGPRYLQALCAYETSVAKNVTANLYERHLQPIFGGC